MLLRIQLLVLYQFLILCQQVVYCAPEYAEYTFDPTEGPYSSQQNYSSGAENNVTNSENAINEPQKNATDFVADSGENATIIADVTPDKNSTAKQDAMKKADDSEKSLVSDEHNVSDDAILEDDEKLLNPVVEQMMVNASKAIKNFTENSQHAFHHQSNDVITTPTVENLDKSQNYTNEGEKPSNLTSQKTQSQGAEFSEQISLLDKEENLQEENSSSNTKDTIAANNVTQSSSNQTVKSDNTKGGVDMLEPVGENLNDTDTQDAQNVTNRQLNATYYRNSTINAGEDLLEDLTFMGEIPAKVNASTAVKNLGESKKDGNNTEYVDSSFKAFQQEGVNQATDAVARIVPGQVPAKNVTNAPKNTTISYNSYAAYNSTANSKFNASQSINNIDALVEKQAASNSTDKVGNLMQGSTPSLNGTNTSNVTKEISKYAQHLENVKDANLQNNSSQAVKNGANATDLDLIATDLENAENEEYTDYFDQFSDSTSTKNISDTKYSGATSQQVNKTMKGDVTDVPQNISEQTQDVPQNISKYNEDVPQYASVPGEQINSTSSQNYTSTQQLFQSDSQVDTPQNLTQNYYYGSNGQKYDYNKMFPYNQNESNIKYGASETQNTEQSNSRYDEQKQEAEMDQQLTVPATVPAEPDAVSSQADAAPSLIQNAPPQHQKSDLESVEKLETQEYQENLQSEQMQGSYEDQTRYATLQQGVEEQEDEVVILGENQGFATNIVIGAVGLFVFVAIVYYGNQWIKKERERQAQYSSLSTYSGEGPLGGGNLPRVQSSGNTSKWNSGWDEGWSSQDKSADEGLLNKRRGKRANDFV